MAADADRTERFDTFLKHLNRVMTPHTQVWGAGFGKVVAIVVGLGVLVALIPVLAAAPFQWNSALPENAIEDSIGSNLKTRSDAARDALLQRCAGGDNCTLKERKEAADAVEAMQAKAAGNSPRAAAYKTYQHLVPLIIGTLLIVVVLAAIIHAQIKLAVRTWQSTLGNAFDAPHAYSLSYQANWILALALPLGAVSVLGGIFLFDQTGIVVGIVLAFLLVIWALLFKSIPHFRQQDVVLCKAPGLVTGLAAALGIVAVMAALMMFDTSGTFTLSQFTIFALLAGTSAGATAITVFLVANYVSTFPRPSHVQDLPNRAAALEDPPKPDPNGTVTPYMTVNGAYGTAPDPEPIWQALRRHAKASGYPINLQWLPSGCTLKPKDIQSDLGSLTATLTVTFLVILLAVAFLTTDLAGTLGDSDATLSAAREAALQSYLLLVGFGFSAVLVLVTVWAQLRMAPFLAAEDSLKKADSGAATSSASDLPWVVEETDLSKGRRKITPLHPVLDETWATDEVARREKARADEEEEKTLGLADLWLAGYTACDAEKFRILYASARYGGALQDLFKSTGSSKVSEYAKIAAPAVLGSALSFFG